MIGLKLSVIVKKAAGSRQQTTPAFAGKSLRLKITNSLSTVNIVYIIIEALFVPAKSCSLPSMITLLIVNVTVLSSSAHSVVKLILPFSSVKREKETAPP